MKAVFKTEELKNILEVVSKGMGNGVILPITEYIELLFIEDTLFATSTDLTSWVTYKKEIEIGFETGEEGKSVIVDGKKLTQLITKTTVPEVELKFEEDYLEVKGNGEYKIPILQEVFPDYTFDKVGEAYTVDIGILKNAVEMNKAAVARDMIMPCLSGYHLSDKLITTDSIKMTINDINFIEDEILLPKEVAELLAILS